ncbi:MAG: Ig-like domain-containing protein [candidate division WOR-3 bacterium]
MKRIILPFIFVLFFVHSCGYKAPPPGKPDWTPPVVKLLNPKDGDTLTSDTPLQVSIQDDSRIRKLVLIVSGKTFMQDSVEPLELVAIIDSIKDSVVEMRVRAFDIWDNVGESNPVKVHILRPQK